MRTQKNFFLGEGADPEGLYDSCLILKTTLWKSRQYFQADI